MFVFLGDGVFCNFVGCGIYSIRGIRCGFWIWREYCCIFVVILVGWVRGRGYGSFTFFLMGMFFFILICCFRVLCLVCVGEGSF